MKLKTITEESSERKLEDVIDFTELHAQNTINAPDREITSLEGCPEDLAQLNISRNQLTSFKGAPKLIQSLNVNGNPITTFRGLEDTTITGELHAQDCEISSFKDGPKFVGHLNLDSNLLSSFEGLEKIKITRGLDLGSNQFTSLKGIHKHLIDFGDVLYLDDNPIKSHVLGLLKVKGLKRVYYGTKDAGRLTKALNIVSKHLKGDRDIFACQEELINTGLEEFAQL